MVCVHLGYVHLGCVHLGCVHLGCLCIWGSVHLVCVCVCGFGVCMHLRYMYIWVCVREHWEGGRVHGFHLSGMWRVPSPHGQCLYSRSMGLVYRWEWWKMM